MDYVWDIAAMLFVAWRGNVTRYSRAARLEADTDHVEYQELCRARCKYS